MSPEKRTKPTDRELYRLDRQMQEEVHRAANRELDRQMQEEVHRAASRAIESADRCKTERRQVEFWRLLLRRLHKASGTPMTEC